MADFGKIFTVTKRPVTLDPVLYAIILESVTVQMTRSVSRYNYTLVYCRVAIVGLFLVAQPAFGSEWFEKENVSCSGVSAVTAAFEAVLPQTLQTSQGLDISKRYVTLGGASFRGTSDRFGPTRVLGPAEARDLERALRTVSDESKVPLLIKAASSIMTGLFLPAISGTTSGILFGIFFDQIDAEPLRIKDAANFIAAGGELYRRSAVLERKIDSAFFLSLTDEYRVSVGQEARTIVLSGCIYAIRFDPSQFTTNGPLNNKIVKKVSQNTWRQWDIEDQRFDPIEAWTYLRQSDGFFYFQSPAIENNQVVGQDQIRIGMMGGPWQKKSFFSGPNANFVTIYPHVNFD